MLASNIITSIQYASKCIIFSYQMMKGLKIHQGFVLFGVSHIVQCMYLHSGLKQKLLLL